MSKAKFTIPDNVKPVSAASKKVYKTYLNRIAAFEIDSIEKVLLHPEDVNEVIDMLIHFEENLEQKKQQARIYYSAIFYVLYQHPFLEDPDNVLRMGFQRYRPGKTSSGEKWLPVEKFKSQEK